MLELRRQVSLSKLWQRQRQGHTCRRLQVNNWMKCVEKWTGLNRAQAGWPSPFSWWFGLPLYIYASWLINSSYPEGPPHPFTRELPTWRRSTRGTNGRRKSLSCLGDGLGHALATMVGLAWWSHGGVLKPCLEFIKAFVHSTFDGDIIISCLYFELLWCVPYSYV
jgi:hypothetical protein